MYQIRDFAKLAGVTVRTLHHYDRLGLLKPRRRTEAGYRLYETSDLERLEQIVALKYLGFSLPQIRTALSSGSGGLLETLCAQCRLLEEKRLRMDQVISALHSTVLQIRTKDTSTAAALRTIIEVIQMEANQDWQAKYATEQGKVKIEARKGLWSAELQHRVSAQWSELIAEVERSLDQDPASATAQALAARWNSLVEEFTGRDPDIEESVAALWANREKWPVDVAQKAPVILPEVWQFIARANRASGYLPRSSA